METLENLNVIVGSLILGESNGFDIFGDDSDYKQAHPRRFFSPKRLSREATNEDTSSAYSAQK